MTPSTLAGNDFRASLQIQYPCQIQCWVSLRINVLNPNAGTNWGQQKETILITTYMPLMHATPIWFPNTSPSLIQKLETIQNSALCMSTGYDMMG